MKIFGLITRMFLFGALAVSLSATAQETRGSMLVLGDSVAFGYISTVGPDYFYTRAENFLGFGDELGYLLGLDVVNASCPGETTGSFLSATAPDNGCRAYRSVYPLHYKYQYTQSHLVREYLKYHHEVRLVTLTLGANDGLLLEEACETNPAYTTPAEVEACILAGAPAVLENVAKNIATILAYIRASGYQGAIVITNYYSTDYSDASSTYITAELDAAIAAPAQAFGAIIADNFSVFKKVAADPKFGGQTCKTGLLNPDVVTPNACNIHPALTGHRLIASTIADALSAADHDWLTR